ncbi:nuclear transport factor 2 family protein [Brevibacillus daliensis]|uniref:nuclear transport factor 2 family protein n=1 Tax=Brevibacillus daliensis TaxID=2892995 RepID=UPI001E3F9ACB|nr:hypothetical protein [Brevibacillus daliensis]
MDNTTNIYGELLISCPKDCDNAPKKNLLKELNIAFAKKNIAFIIEHLADDVFWNIVGYKLIQGKDNIAENLRQMKNSNVLELQINNIITHGKSGAANGIFIFEQKKSYAFSNVYVFSGSAKNAKIKEITSYVIAVS